MNKSFDCVEFKHAMQERVQNEIKGMNAQQINEHFQKTISESPLSDFWNRVKDKSSHQQIQS
ncbi:MAG: hypothetical protein WCP79_14755 [Bacillota bacterium]